MFEQAVAYLGTFAPVTAVHFAVALAYYGLLRVSDFYTSGEEIRKFAPSLLMCEVCTADVPWLSSVS